MNQFRIILTPKCTELSEQCQYLWKIEQQTQIASGSTDAIWAEVGNGGTAADVTEATQQASEEMNRLIQLISFAATHVI